MEMLRKNLSDFKEVTYRLVGCLENDKFDDLEELFNERQHMIDSIGNLNYKQEQFIGICDELQIVDAQKKLEAALEEKMKNVKKEIRNISVSKNVNKSYHKGSAYVDSIFFNKKL